MPLKVRRLPQALSDGLEIWLRIAVDNLSAADAVTQRLDNAIERLSDYPELGLARPKLGRGIRILPVENITIFYRLAPDAVEIVRVLHAARDITADVLSD